MTDINLISNDNFEFDVKNASTDSLSFIGDAVYSLLVRRRLIAEGQCRSNALHSLSAGYVNAAAQAKAFFAIENMLTECETAVYKRGRNAHNNHKPKRADCGDYRVATGLEALFGYIYLSGENARINELFNVIWQEKE